MRLTSHLCPVTRINTGSSLYQTILVFLLRLLRNLCAFCVRPRIPSAPSAFASAFIPPQAKPQKPRQPVPMRLPSHLCPATRINTGSSISQIIFGIPFCDFCVTFAPFAFAPVFLCVRSRIHPNQANPQNSDNQTPCAFPAIYALQPA